MIDFNLFCEKTGTMRKKFSELEIEKLKKETEFLDDKSTIRERVHCVVNNINSVPCCPVCGNNVNFLRENRYAIYCSNFCKNNSKEHNDRIFQTKLERYDNGSFCNQDKMMETKEERYGYCFYTNPEKIKQTCLEKYGVDNPAKSKEIRDRLSISLAKNYQSRRNEAGDDYSGVVYILHFPELEAVKIGLTGSKKGRFKGLKRDFGEFSVVKLIETETCRKLESEFHEKFDEYRICLEEGCGRTEFFKEDILKEIR